VDLRDTGWEDDGWIELNECHVWWWTSMLMVLKLMGLLLGSEFSVQFKGTDEK